MWKGLPDEGVGFGVVREHATTRVCIKTGPWTYVARTINGRYPDWRQVLPDAEDMAHQIRFINSALEALQASFESAKVKLRETQSALVEVGASLRDAHKEERQRRNEAESVRSTLRKLQSIRV